MAVGDGGEAVAAQSGETCSLRAEAVVAEVGDVAGARAAMAAAVVTGAEVVAAM